MTAAVNKNIHSKTKQKMIREFETFETKSAKLILGDCVQVIQSQPDQSVGFSIFSPPFAELYTYSDELEDMGNSKNYEEFLFAFGFLIKDLFRVTQDGRNVAVHCMDLPIQKGKEGFIGLRDFSGLILRAFEDAGFIYHTRVTIWKDPVTEMQRTKALGLLHKQIKKDAVMSRVGIPDYLLVFRKPGENLNPVTHQDTDSAKPDYLPVGLWQKYASPVWHDIDYSDTLNFREGRVEKDEKHICPLQLPTIERALHLWSNEGDTVLSPFAGIGSEIYQSVNMGRYGIGYELNKSYFDLACKNINQAELAKMQMLLFS
jgi:DNA modification methylase